MQFIDNLLPELYESIQKQLKMSYELLKAAPQTFPETPYTTVVHRDFWIANIMIKKGKIKLLLNL